MARNPNSAALLRLASQWRGRTVGLYGGSFNPAHEGHVHVAKEALRRLDLDAVWLMVSPGNPLKDKSDMAKRKKRKKSLRSLVARRPGMVISDIEKHLGTRYTADTIERLVRAMPMTRFVWIMGADNLVGFPRWHRWRFIADTVPIAIFDRPGYSVAGLNSRFARQYARYRVPYRQLCSANLPAWTFVPIKRHPGSATDIRHHKGKKWWR